MAATCSLLKAPPILLLTLFLTAASAAAAAAAAAAASASSTTLQTSSRLNKLIRNPGFVYSRSRGRCTPQFWSTTPEEEWPRMVPPTATLVNVFGSRANERYRSDMTVLESTSITTKDDDDDDDGSTVVYGELVKQASAALLNSYARKGFPYSAWEVKTLTIQALVSEDAAARLAKQFSLANHICL